MTVANPAPPPVPASSADDLEQRVRARTRELEETNAQLRAANEHQDRLLSIVAHDLRSPLGLLESLAELLAGDCDLPAAERQELLQAMVGTCRSTRNLLNGLLELAKIHQGTSELCPRPVAIQPFIESVVQWHRRMCEAQGLRLKAVVDCEAAEYTFDPDRLALVLNNLISRAAKVSRRDATITVQVTGRKAELTFAVADQGPGLSTADLARLLGASEQAGPQVAGGEAVAGLGVVICQHLTRVQGGSLHVESEAGHGSRFWFLLPVT